MFSGVFCSISSGIKAGILPINLFSIFRWVKKLLFILFQFKADKGFQTRVHTNLEVRRLCRSYKGMDTFKGINFQIHRF